MDPERILKFVDEDVAFIYKDHISLDGTDVIMCQVAKQLKNISIQLELLNGKIKSQNGNDRGDSRSESNDKI
jgi:hypothetical protein